MPLEINLPEDAEQISLADYVACLRDGPYDLSSAEGLIETAPLLKKLGNNKSFLLDFLFDKLRTNLDFQFKNAYGPEVFLLHAEPRFFLRANIWVPRQKIFARIPGFRYDICHDHNFHILTIGYTGPGYQSMTFEYDQDAHVGAIGEYLRLPPCETFTLSEGKIALYRAKKDIHTQLPPPALSVSINLIPRTRHSHEAQIEIDEASGQILRYLDFAGSDAAIRIAGLLGDEDQLDSLEKIARTHSSQKVRALAVLAQMQIALDRANDIEAEAEIAQSPLTRSILQLEKSRYGGCMNYGHPPRSALS